MTVCIAAACESIGDRKCIVLCTDTRMSGVLGSSEFKFKDYLLADHWTCLISGSEGDALALISLLTTTFRATEIDETNVVQLVRDVLAARKKEKIEELVRGKYGISYDKFLEIGKSHFPDAAFRETIFQIGEILIGASCIVAGFAETDFMLLETDQRGHVHVRGDFVAIGEGGQACLRRAPFDERDGMYVTLMVTNVKVMSLKKRQ